MNKVCVSALNEPREESTNAYASARQGGNDDDEKQSNASPQVVRSMVCMYWVGKTLSSEVYLYLTKNNDSTTLSKNIG